MREAATRSQWGWRFPVATSRSICALPICSGLEKRPPAGCGVVTLHPNFFLGVTKNEAGQLAAHTWPRFTRTIVTAGDG
jgi:hypothetical protein